MQIVKKIIAFNVKFLSGSRQKNIALKRYVMYNQKVF